MPAIRIEKKPEADQNGQPQYEITEANRLPAWGADASLTTVGQPRPRGEALHFAYFSLHELPEKRWPGTDHLIATLLARHQAT